MKTETPNFMASHELLWLQADGTEVPVTARVGTPYAIGDMHWACPAELAGIDGRYPDFHGVTSIHALSNAMRMVSTRLGHLLDKDERLVWPQDTSTAWDRSSLVAVFGQPFVAPPGAVA